MQSDMDSPFDAVLTLPFGWLGVRTRDGQVTVLELSQQPLVASVEPDALARRVCERLAAYLAGGEWPQEFPLAPEGTPFQRAVWSAMRRIAPGHTRTYGDLAKELGSSARAVGGACRANPIALLIPCHRIVAKQGEGGFAGHSSGSWPAIKHRLLEIEAG